MLGGEGVRGTGKSRRWPGVVFDWLIPDPRQQAVIAFLAKTLAGSSQHRMILMGFAGFGLAIFLSGLIGMQDMVRRARVLAADVVYAHTILPVFLLISAVRPLSRLTELQG